MTSETRMSRTILALARRAAAWPFRVAAARATMRALANMDGRELADIGLSRSDLRDALALPLDRDPGELFSQRARERHERAFAGAAPRGDGRPDPDRRGAAGEKKPPPQPASARRTRFVTAG